MLSIDNLSIFIGKKQICKNLTLTLTPKKVWGILGPNGCGKTTLLHTFAGLHPFANGTISLAGMHLTSLKKKAIAQKIGVLFQDFSLFFKQTVWEYCLLARYPQKPYFSTVNQYDQAIIFDALKKTALLNYQHRSINELSGGEKKRLAIAALLIQTPMLYLLDEPTNHLDLRYQTRLLQVFCDLAHQHGATIVVALHDINLAARYCDAILLHFPNGNIWQGEKEEMLTPENLSHLFQVPFVRVSDGKRSFWYSE